MRNSIARQGLVGLVGLLGLAFATGLLSAMSATAAPSVTYTVNSVADLPDDDPGDGDCETAPGNNICTLRAAIMETNVTFSIFGNTVNVPTGTYILSQAGFDDTAAGGDLDITTRLTLMGAGPGVTVIDGSGLGERALHVLSNIPVLVSGVTIANANSGFQGGGIVNQGRLTIHNSAIISNTAVQEGGGIYSISPLTISNSTIGGNSATGFGGGIYMFTGTLTIRNSTLSGNTGLLGGGFAGSADAIIINSTISSNRAKGNGGGFWVSGGVINLYNVTVASNVADFDNNDSLEGGGIMHSGGVVNFQNTLLADNVHIDGVVVFPIQTPDDCKGTLTSAGYNLIEDTTGCTIAGSATGNITGVDPALGPLANNGGPTRTHAPLAGSPAIDTANSGGCNDNLGAPLLLDQRGAIRPSDGDANGNARCDIGAFEVLLRLWLPMIAR